jgi:uncharacterized membrane protein
MAEFLSNIDWTSALMLIGVVVSIFVALLYGRR